MLSRCPRPKPNAGSAALQSNGRDCPGQRLCLPSMPISPICLRSGFQLVCIRHVRLRHSLFLSPLGIGCIAEPS